MSHRYIKLGYASLYRFNVHLLRSRATQYPKWILFSKFFVIGSVVTWSVTLLIIEFLRIITRDEIIGLHNIDPIILSFGYYRLPIFCLALSTILHIYFHVNIVTAAASVLRIKATNTTTDLLIITPISVHRLILYTLASLVRHFFYRYLFLMTLYTGIAITLGVERNRVLYFYFSNNSPRFMTEVEFVSHFASIQSLSFMIFTIFIMCFSHLILISGFALLSTIFVPKFRVAFSVFLQLSCTIVLIYAVPRIFLSIGVTDSSIIILPITLGYSFIDGGLGVAIASVSPIEFPVFWGAPPNIPHQFHIAIPILYAIICVIVAVSITFLSEFGLRKRHN